MPFYAKQRLRRISLTAPAKVMKLKSMCDSFL